MHPHFDIRNFKDNMASVVQKMPAFQHEFYAIAIRKKGAGIATTGNFESEHHQEIFFNSPFQIISWDIMPDWEGYYLMFSSDFVAQSKLLQNLIIDFPFLTIDKTMPFGVNHQELQFFHTLFEQIASEYYGNQEDAFQFIEAQVYLMLLQIKRCYRKLGLDAHVAAEIRNSNVRLFSRFRSMIEVSFSEQRSHPSMNPHSTKSYAAQLHIHPNYLNATVKKVTGKTALQHIHEHIIYKAKSYLLQTSLSVKEIAYQLHFESPNRFNAFFKKHVNQTPLAYREQA